MLISRVRFSFSFSFISSSLSNPPLRARDHPTLENPLAHNCASRVRDLCAIHFFAFILSCHIHIHAATVHVCVPLPVPAGFLLPDA
ncbi:hypothetical protein F5148DRAFT_1202033, partial [Russula earlei]